MTERGNLGALVIAFLVVLLILMYTGWRRRQRRQRDLGVPATVPESPGTELFRADVQYVATTRADAPLDRIAVAGLGFRGRAAVAVFESGVALGIAGQPDIFLPATSITGVDRASATIDRVVERGGLVRITWLLGSDPLDSYLRSTDAAAASALLDAIRRIIPTTGRQTP